jgi:hypothetical protein
LADRRLLSLTVGLVAAGLLALAAPARAEDRAFCADRPGQTTPPCTLAPGTVMIETALGTWERESEPGSRSDTLTLGSSLLRAGVTSRLEAQIGWAPLGVQWQRDAATGAVQRRTSAGDLTLGLTYGLAGANGPVAVQGFATVPTGGSAIGAGDWGAGLRLPAQVALTSGIDLVVTPEIDAAVNQSGEGRHLAYGGAVGIALALSDTVNLGGDLAAFRDQEPGDPITRVTGGLSLAWQAGEGTQIDMGTTAGINQDSPDLAVYLGIAHRF